MPLTKDLPLNTMGSWQPERRYLISTDSDWVISSDAEARRTSGGLPRENCFTLSDDPKRIGDRLPLRDLSHLTIHDRLDLTGHGSSGSFEGMQAHEVAKMLVDAGLKEVGVIKFHSCDSGKGTFLEDVGHELRREWKARRIRGHDGGEAGYGHISGIEGASINTSTSFSMFGKRFNVGLGGYVSHGGDGFGNFLKNQIYTWAVVPQAIRAISHKEYFHIRSVPGNIPVTVHGTRYKANPAKYAVLEHRYAGVGSTARNAPTFSRRSARPQAAPYRAPSTEHVDNVDHATISANERLLHDNIEGLNKHYTAHDDPNKKAIEALLKEDGHQLDRQKRWADERENRSNRTRSR